MGERFVVYKLGVVLWVVSACGPGGASESASSGESTSAESGSGEEGTNSTTADTGSTTADTGETDAGSEDTGETEGHVPICGDGVVDPGELCDGPTPDGLPCSEDCLHPGIRCGGALRSCGDAEDNDSDGLIDLDDPDCLNPCDDVEGYYTAGFPGGGADPVLSDCYWDSNTGRGDDHCDWNLICDPASPGAPNYPYDPNFGNCNDMQPPECLDVCVPMAPNGCDCFGCCEVDGQTIYLGFQTGDDTCSAQTHEACNPCTLYMGCFNPCEPDSCELCFGQGPEALAPSCDEPSCAMGVQSCASSYECGLGLVCQTGCCVPYEVP